MTVHKDELPMNDRMCIVTRESGPADTLIRFVAGPDGIVVPDLKRQLPGRGCSVKASRALVDQAVKKQLFACALKTDVKALPELGAQVDRLLLSQLTGMMNMARKAGQFISGTMKVDDAVRTFRLPYGNGLRLSVGTSYRLNHRLAIDLGYSFVAVEDTDIRAADQGGPESNGPFSGSAETIAHYVSAAIKLRFGDH